MIHHPPIRGATANHKRMIGIRRFAAVMREAGAELVLHGHTHLNTLYHLQGKNGQVPVVGIASASQGPGGHKPPASYNLFSIEAMQASGTLSASVSSWTKPRPRFRLDIEETL